MKILLATANPHKVSELRAILSVAAETQSLEFVSLADFPDLKAVVEDGATLEQNAVKKALSAALDTGLWALADDTGLEVAALDGAPGVYSARYAGENCDYAANCEKLIDAMKGKSGTEREAVFRCVAALCSPQGQVRISVGRLAGRVTESAFGRNGFGYDPIFLVLDRDKTLAEMAADEKNEISHRRKAVAGVIPWLAELAQEVG